MDKAEFSAAVERYQDTVYRAALHYFGNRQDAEDAVQEVFLRLYAAGKTFSSENYLRRWLLRVTVNVCKDALKSPWRKKRVYLDALPETPVFDEPAQRELYQAVMALPEKYRTVLNLFYYEELSVREIAEILETSPSTVTTRLSRARTHLKDRLEVWQDE